MSKVAIASTDGITINEHFRKASQFLIYEVNSDGTHQLIETRVVSSNNIEGNESNISEVINLISDVKLVLAIGIGPGAVKLLHSKSIIALNLEGNIDNALNSYAKRGKVLELLVSDDTKYFSSQGKDRASCPIRAAKLLGNLF